MESLDKMYYYDASRDFNTFKKDPPPTKKMVVYSVVETLLESQQFKSYNYT